MSNSDSIESLEKFKERIKRFMELDIETARKEFNLGKDSRDWKVQYAKEELESTGNNPNNYVKIHYRPFDYRWTYYTGKSKGFHCMPRGEVMQHFLHDFDNMGISIPRQLKDTGKEWNHCMMTNTTTDQALTSGGNGAGVIHPLYIKDSVIASERSERGNPQASKQAKSNKETADKSAHNDDIQWVENFTQEFREFIDSKYNEHFSPEQILGYIYAVLFHKEYREKYLDFLKIDFPKIPFVESKEKFLEFSELGSSLISLHLLQDNALDSNIGKLQKIGKDESKIIEKPSYNAESQRLFINKSLYFDKVDSRVWEYKIGGYQVLDKYLKSHKGEAIDFIHFQKIIQTLHKSLEIESKITAIEIA